MGLIDKFAKTIDDQYVELMTFLWGEAPRESELLPEVEPIVPSQQQYISYIMPAKGPLVSRHAPGEQYATPTHPKGHTGIDIGGNRGDPIVAIAPGYVANVGYGSKKGGNWITTIHENGRVRAYYAHLDSINVQKGQQVQQGEVLGGMGDTGNAKGRSVHLHFQVSIDNSQINPLTIADKPIGSLHQEKLASIENLVSFYKGAMKLSEELSHEEIRELQMKLFSLMNEKYNTPHQAIEAIKAIFSPKGITLMGPRRVKEIGPYFEVFELFSDKTGIIDPAYVGIDWRKNEDNTVSFTGFLVEGRITYMDKPTIDLSQFER